MRESLVILRAHSILITSSMERCSVQQEIAGFWMGRWRMETCKIFWRGRDFSVINQWITIIYHKTKLIHRQQSIQQRQTVDETGARIGRSGFIVRLNWRLSRRALGFKMDWGWRIYLIHRKLGQGCGHHRQMRRVLCRIREVRIIRIVLQGIMTLACLKSISLKTAPHNEWQWRKIYKKKSVPRSVWRRINLPKIF